MRIVTNPGSNLTPELLARYDIDLTPSRIVVDGVEHDTRTDIQIADVDRWVETAKEHPYVLGTSAAEFMRFFAQVSADDPEILAVMTSRKLIQSYDAACSAARTMEKMQGKRRVDVRVVDTYVTDAGAGMTALLAALAREDGQSLEQVEALLDAFVSGMRMRLWVANLDNLIKGGRASFLRGFLANLLKIRPILELDRGELKVAEKISTKVDPVEHIAERIGHVHRGRPVWAAVLHGNVPEEGERLAARLRELLDIEFLYVQPFSPSIYLHAGHGALGVFTAPVDRLPWRPPVPSTGPARGPDA